MKTCRFIVSFILISILAAVAAAQSAPAVAALAKMQVKEVTVFKDGHAFVLHEGAMPTDGSGNVLLDYLPTPVLGTFWPYSSDRNIKLTSVVASQHRVMVERTSLNLAQLLDGNPGAEVWITEKPSSSMKDGATYPATIVGIPQRSSQEMESTSPPNTGEMLPQKGDVIMLRTAEGIKVVSLDRIQDVTFKGQMKSGQANEEFRNLLTLKLDWGARRAEKNADVGLVYLQRGIRWIQSYKVTIDGNGNAQVKLQAALINEMTDLNDVTANLVIGVPTFAFKDNVDPISLQQTAQQLSGYFQQGDRSAIASNMIASQVALSTNDYRSENEEPQPVDLGPEVTDSTRSEDLFVFTVKHVTLKKGQRMVLPVAEYTLKYKDVFALDIPFAPPPEVQANVNTQQQAEMARLLSAPKVMHKIRLLNQSSYPLTTAPALIFRDDRVLAQGMMTYAAIGGNTDLDITKSVDIHVKKSDNETKRTPNAVQWHGYDYGRVDLKGTISLTNYKKQPVEIEVTRHVLGNASSADHDGVITKINVFENDRYTPSGQYPVWWGWYSWPDWWSQVNGVGLITWKVSLEPDKGVDLGYEWNYFWR